jgi:hypothetical protein
MKQSTLLKRLESLLNTTRLLNLELVKYNMRQVDVKLIETLIREMKS